MTILKKLLSIGQGEGLRAQLFRGGAGVGMLKVLSLALTLLATIMLARSLGPDGFGQYAFVIALVTTLSIPLAPALMQLTTREAATLHQAGELSQVTVLLRWANRLVLVSSLLIISVAGVAGFYFANWQGDDRWTLLLLGLLSLPLLGLNAVRAGVLAGFRRVVRGQVPELFVRPFGLVLFVALLVITDALTPLSALVGFIFAACSAFIVGFVLLKRILPESKLDSSQSAVLPHKTWFRAWIPFTLLVAASTLNAQIGILLLGWLGSNEAVAAMQVAERGAMLVVLSLTVVNLVIGPHIAQVHQQGDSSKLQALSRQSARMALLIAFPIAMPLVFFGEEILSVVFGQDYAGIAALPLAILAIGQLINVGFGSVGMLLTMSGYERDTLLGQVVALVINVLAAVVLIPPLGAVGAAIATGLGLMVWNSVLAVLVFRRLSVVPSPFSLGGKP